MHLCCLGGYFIKQSKSELAMDRKGTFKEAALGTAAALPGAPPEGTNREVKAPTTNSWSRWALIILPNKEIKSMKTVLHKSQYRGTMITGG